MRPLILVAALAFSSHAHADCAEDAAFLAAIAQVEGHEWSTAGGKYALSFSAWRGVTSLPYDSARIPAIGTRMAYRHLDWLRNALKRQGIAPTPYVLAGCWRSGLTRWTSGKAPASHRDYAARVVALYGEATLERPSAPSRLVLSAQAP